MLTLVALLFICVTTCIRLCVLWNTPLEFDLSIRSENCISAHIPLLVQNSLGETHSTQESRKEEGKRKGRGLGGVRIIRHHILISCMFGVAGSA